VDPNRRDLAPEDESRHGWRRRVVVGSELLNLWWVPVLVIVGVVLLVKAIG
jgi:hypothetical protein